MDFKEEIIKMVKEIESKNILEYLYIIVLDVYKEDKGIE